MTKKLKALRHGEAMLVPVDAMPKGKTKKYSKFTVAHSETGHNHVLESSTEFEVLEDKNMEVYFRIFEPATLVHKKTVDRHKDLVVEPGIYKRFEDTEYDPFSQLIRRVRD